MGINGLLPFLEKSSKRANIKEFSGQAVAIDGYCWLHKGAFSCAEKLVMKEPTTMYVGYCMKFINMLLSHNIKPILVFDGRYLPAKAGTETKRRENREKNRKKGAELLRAGRVDEGRSFLRRSVDVNHEMALNVIKECRRKNVDCIVAPYEADAQLAYLNLKNIAQVVITEDSDLLLFGCTRVLFKMDCNGNGVLIEKDRLHLSMGIRSDSFNFDKFRYMCILSGCDYLPSLPGIGLTKACRFVNRTSETNIHEALRKLPVNLNMWTLVVPDEYRDNFVEADNTFKFQLVYDPVQRRQVPLNEVDSESEVVGTFLDEELAFQLALGNYDPMSLKQMDSYNPDETQHGNNRLDKFSRAFHPSIWSVNFMPKTPQSENSRIVVRKSTMGICVSARISLSKKRANDCEASKAPDLNKEELLNFYGGESKRSCDSLESETSGSKASSDCLELSTEINEDSLVSPTQKSPVFATKRNPFALRSKHKSSAKKNNVGALAKFTLAANSEDLLISRYFSPIETSQGSSTDFQNSTFGDKKKQESLLEQQDSSPEEETLLSLYSGSESKNLSRNESSSISKNSSRVEINEVSVTEESSEISSITSTSRFVSRKKLFSNILIDKEDSFKSSQEENCLNISNVSTSNKNVQMDIEKGEGKTASDGENSSSCSVKKTFYEAKCENDIYDSVSRPKSLFFGQTENDDSVIPARKSFLNTVAPGLRSSSVKSKPSRRTAPKTGLSKLNPQQSNLFKFGFQPRLVEFLSVVKGDST